LRPKKDISFNFFYGEHDPNDPIKPTHLQHYTRLSCDKISDHLKEPGNIAMIIPTERWIYINNCQRQFIKKYNDMTNLIQSFCNL